MKPDYDYTINILEVFIQNDKPNVRIEEFDRFLAEDQNKFFFNILILRDKGLWKAPGKILEKLG